MRYQLQTPIFAMAISLLLAVGCGQDERDHRQTQSKGPAFSAHGDQVGNGGMGIQCHEEVELLDFYEGEVLHGFFPDFAEVARDEAVMEKVFLAIDRLTSLDPRRSSVFMTDARSFWDEATLVVGPLVRTEDSHHIIAAPSGCDVVQIAIQRPPRFAKDHYYTIDRHHWSRMSVDHQAGLVLHEVIYRQSIREGHQSSRSSRVLNNYLASGEISLITQDEYRQLLEDLGLAPP